MRLSSMPRLTTEQMEYIMEGFHCGITQEGKFGWSRRQYAPMYIHEPIMASYRESILKQLPDYTIAFDVLFEAPPHRGVDYHCDYESLGPFTPPGIKDVFHSHFVSVHANLTHNGGSLTVMPWPLLSTVFSKVICHTGIYSRLHRFLNALCHPLFCLFARKLPNDVGVGNIFDNMRLHSVTPGEERVSYVVRLVRKPRDRAPVRMTKESVMKSRNISNATSRLADVILPHIWDDDVVLDASSFDWKTLLTNKVRRD